MRYSKFVLPALGLLVLGFAAPAHADIAFNFTGGSSGFGQTATYGFTFTPVVDISVDSLGFIDYAQDGLAAGHRVGIWDASGTLLGSTTVTTANSTLAGPVINSSNRFRYTPVTHFSLTAGSTYTLGAAEETSADRFFAGNAASLTQISAAPSLVTVASSGVFSTSNFTKPTLTVGFRYGAGSFTASAVTADTPEPGSIALLTTGGLTGAAFLRRKRIRKTA